MWMRENFLEYFQPNLFFTKKHQFLHAFIKAVLWAYWICSTLLILSVFALSLFLLWQRTCRESYRNITNETLLDIYCSCKSDYLMMNDSRLVSLPWSKILAICTDSCILNCDKKRNNWWIIRSLRLVCISKRNLKINILGWTNKNKSFSKTPNF